MKRSSHHYQSDVSHPLHFNPILPNSTGHKFSPPPLNARQDQTPDHHNLSDSDTTNHYRGTDRRPSPRPKPGPLHNPHYRPIPKPRHQPRLAHRRTRLTIRALCIHRGLLYNGLLDKPIRKT
ncbi:unnamed protein product [Pleuronectes platessa]|uniref:Uncharacterized protein n=1 Tax=Pleuronectes platessa TaxID=8262 RepID=A0A9N7U7P5_PLEPL|nr:unnamed protein product [Pleuronectes platessa]